MNQSQRNNSLSKLNELDEKARINSDIKGQIKDNVAKYMQGYDSQGRNIRNETKRKSMEAAKEVLRMKREKVKTAFIVGGLIIVVVGLTLAFKYAWDTSPLYGKQHDPSATPIVTQQYEGGNAHGSK